MNLLYFLHVSPVINVEMNVSANSQYQLVLAWLIYRLGSIFEYTVLLAIIISHVMT